MLKYCYEKWNKNKDKLEAALRKTDISRVEYRDLLVLTVKNILNDEDDYVGPTWSTKGITEINDGDYQGTLLYLIPEDTYQPSEYEYLMTYIGYGSCSCCDLLQSIQPDSFEEIDDDDIAEFMALCKDFITNMIKPYNYGWRYNEEFEHVTMEEEE
jgi:hypothetical protein